MGLAAGKGSEGNIMVMALWQEASEGMGGARAWQMDGGARCA